MVQGQFWLCFKQNQMMPLEVIQLMCITINIFNVKWPLGLLSD